MGWWRLRGSGTTVVTKTSRVNGKTESLTPCRSETPKNIKTKIGLNDYVIDPCNRANFRGNRSKAVCSPNGWNTTHLSLCVHTFSFFLVFAYSKIGWMDFHDPASPFRKFFRESLADAWSLTFVRQRENCESTTPRTFSFKIFS